MYYQIGKFDLSNQFIRAYSVKNIINLVKQYTIKKLYKINTLTNIYIQIFMQLNNEWNKIKLIKTKIKITIKRNKPANHNNNDYNNTQLDRQQHYFVCFIS